MWWPCAWERLFPAHRLIVGIGFGVGREVKNTSGGCRRSRSYTPVGTRPTRAGHNIRALHSSPLSMLSLRLTNATQRIPQYLGVASLQSATCRWMYYNAKTLQNTCAGTRAKVRVMRGAIARGSSRQERSS